MDKLVSRRTQWLEEQEWVNDENRTLGGVKGSRALAAADDPGEVEGVMVVEISHGSARGKAGQGGEQRRRQKVKAPWETVRTTGR
jgi:hypothetical protein